MIKANELRIGNWVKYTNDQSLKNGLANTWVNVTDDIIKWAANPSENVYEPILLTPEVLEKCGFEKTWKMYELDFSDKLLSDRRYEFFCYEKDLPNCSYTLNSITAANNFSFLHQLQNLYFALTGEELEIKL